MFRFLINFDEILFFEILNNIIIVLGVVDKKVFLRVFY